MDITQTFKSYIKTEKLRRSIDTDKKSTLKFRSRKDDFNSKSRDVVYHITKLKEYLIEHKQQYTKVTSLGSSMSDIEREKIDNAARSIFRNCSLLLKELSSYVKNDQQSTQLSDHRKGVLEIVENYLKTVFKIHSDMKEFYAKRQLEYNSMLKMKPSASSNNEQKVKQEVIEDKEDNFRKPFNQDVNDEIVGKHAASFIEELTEEELQMFEVENEELINELNSLKSDVKAIEQKVTHIAELQGTFTEMVLQQDSDIQRIDTRLVNTTENLQDANTELRKAVQNNASFRMYVLFFMLMMSFTLLFLNWYND